MTEAERLIEAVEQDPTPVGRMWRLRDQPDRGALLSLAPFALASVAVSWLILTQPAVARIYLTPLALFLAALPTLFLPLTIIGRAVRYSRREAIAVWTLRQVAALPSDDPCWLAKKQPQPPDASDADSERRLRHVRWMDNVDAQIAEQSRSRRAGPFLTAGLLLYAIYESGIRITPKDWGIDSQPLLLFALILAYAPFIAFLVRRSFGNLRSGTLLVATADGLRWTVSRRQYQVRWDQVRSFSQIDFRNRALWGPQPMYVLDAGEAILAWGYDPTVAVGGNAADYRDLNRVVVSHSGLPLRDLTGVARTVASALDDAEGRGWLKKLDDQEPAELPLELAPMRSALRIPAPARPIDWGMLALSFLPLLALLALYAAAALNWV